MCIVLVRVHDVQNFFHICHHSSLLHCRLYSQIPFTLTSGSGLPLWTHVTTVAAQYKAGTVHDGMLYPSVRHCPLAASAVGQLAWRSGNVVGRINEVNSTSSPVSTGMGDVSGFDSRRRHFISVCNQPTRSTQPFILSGSIN